MTSAARADANHGAWIRGVGSGGDEIVAPKNGRSRPEERASISDGRIFFCLETGRAEENSAPAHRAPGRPKIRSESNKRIAPCSSIATRKRALAGASGRVSRNLNSAEILDRPKRQADRKIRRRFARQPGCVGIRFHSQKANRPGCVRARNAEIGRQSAEVSFNCWLHDWRKKDDAEFAARDKRFGLR